MPVCTIFGGSRRIGTCGRGSALRTSNLGTTRPRRIEQRRLDLIARVQQYHFVPQTPNELERLYYFMADFGIYEAYYPFLVEY